MKCPNCGEEMGEQNQCSKCGSTKAEQNSTSFEAVHEKGGECKRSKIPFIMIVLLLLVIIALVAYYMTIMAAPRYIFDKKIHEFLSSEEEEDYNTIRVNADFEIAVNSEEAEIQEISNLLNDTKFSFTTELDKSTKEELIALKLLKGSEELLNANMKLEAETQKLYFNLGQLLDKTIQMELSEISDETFEITDTSVANFSQMVNRKKAELIFQKEIKSELKKEYFSAEKMMLNDENVTKNTLRMSEEQLIEMVKNVAEHLSQNQDFIGCFEEEEELKEQLQDVIDEVEEIEIQEDLYFEMNVYTTGIKKTVKRVDLSAEEEDEKVTIQLTKANEEEYSYELFENDEKILEGTIKYQEDKNHFNMEISARAEETEVVAKLSGNITYDEPLSDFDTSNAVDYEELTTEDIYTLAENFMNSKFYQIVQEFSNTNTTPFVDSSEEEIQTQKETEAFSNLPENMIKTYDDVTIQFEIPEGFEMNSSGSENYKLFEKELEDIIIEVKVSTAYDTLDEYLGEIKETAEFFEEDEDFQNIKVSEPQEVEIAGGKFKKLVFSYDYELFDGEIQKNEITYIVCQIDSKNLYTVEIDGSNLMTDKELEKFLTIKK